MLGRVTTARPEWCPAARKAATEFQKNEDEEAGQRPEG